LSRTLFTAAGCARCNIARKFMQEKGIAYEDHDISGEGRDLFGQFYRAHRSAIFRGPEGIEFPVMEDGESVRQGVGAVIGYLHSGAKLDGFIGLSNLSKGWIDGLHVSGGDPAMGDDLAGVLGFMKKSGLKLQLDINGKNSPLLNNLLERGLGDRVIMDLKGPQGLYRALLGEEIDPAGITRTMELVMKFPDYRFETTVSPVQRERGSVDYLTPEEIEETARWLKEATGSHKQPYLLRLFHPETCVDERFRAIDRLPPQAHLRYRTASRKHQVLTEIEKAPQ
jgi:pyruvate-formate lyase-activating enzyme/glutaredoxin